MKKDFFISLALVAIILTVCILNIVSFAQACDSVRRDVLRLHVVADSNSETDQKLKLLVRDAVLEKGGELFEGTVTVDTAKAEILPRIDELKAVATKVLRENGCKNSVEITVTEEYFNTRCYEDFTMPAGVYTAVRVNIGSAGGQNWWCVMFPPLCVPVADGEIKTDDSIVLEEYLGSDGKKIVTSEGKFKMGFKIVEIYEKLFKD